MRGLFRRIAVVTSGALLLQGLAGGVAMAAGSAPVLKWTPSASGAFSYGTVSSGRSLSQVFTLTNTGKKATGSLSVKLTGSATFAVTKDACASVSLRPHRTCKVTVAFAPLVNGQVSAGTLTAASTKPAVKASLTLKGTAAKKPLTMSTRPSKGGTVGVASVTDTARLSGGVAPTGTVSFALHGPSAHAKCRGSAVFSRQVPVNGDGSYAPAVSFTPSQAGTYWWTVTYSGDARNNPVATECDAESVTISQAIPGIAGTANPAIAPPDTLLKVSAALTGGDHPAGAIQFRLYSATDCSGTPVDTETVGVDGDGHYSTPTGFAASAVGTYEWIVAYIGNVNNAPATTACGAEPVQIGHPVGSQPDAIAFDGTNMWVANFGSGNVTELSPSGQVIATVSVGDEPDGIAFDHTNMWVANAGSGNVTEISPAGLVLRTVNVGRFPTGVAFDGTNIWVAIGGSGNVTELSPTGTFLGAFTVGTAPQGIAFDGTNMWVANTSSGNVTKLSPTGQVLGTFPVGMNPEAIAFDGTNMWVTNAASATVTELSPTGQVLGTPGVGSEPEAIAFDGTNMWVANAASDNVTELSLARKVLGTFPAGSNPDAIAFDGTNLWIPDNDSDDVIEIPVS